MDVHITNGETVIFRWIELNAPQRFFGAGLTMCELISANHDGNKARDFSYRSSKERLQSGEAGIKWRLGVGCERN